MDGEISGSGAGVPAGDVPRSAEMADGMAQGDSAAVRLADGTTATLRPISEEDGPAVVRFHSRLSPETIWLRYFSPHPTLTDREVERLCRSGDPDHLALVALRGDDIIGIAQYDRAVGSDEAETAFAVLDAEQGNGVGTLLLEHLAARARLHGVKRFAADTLAVNNRMLGVFGSVGFARQSSMEAGVVHIVLDIAPTADALEAADRRDARAVVRSLERLLRPGSVAVIGASRRPGTIGHELVRNLVRGAFQGPVYPVNPSARQIASIPCWPSIDDVPGDVDLAVIAVPADSVVEVAEACGHRHVGGLVIVSTGFAESSPEGLEAQRELVAIARRHGMRIVGPNCFGVLNTDPAVSLNATFAADAPVAGRVGFASQSGGLGIAILGEARSRGIGLSTFVSMGNKADVSGNDVLEWWEHDDGTAALLLYLESFGNPRKFSRLARRIGRNKPILVVKSGRSGAGRRAASSHTAALASPDEAVDALLAQAGVLRVDTVEELFDAASVLVDQPLPDGRRVAIVTNSGGPGVLAADACSGQGMVVPELRRETQEALRHITPGAGSVLNPVDLGASGTAASYQRSLQVILASGEVDAAVVVFTPPLVTETDDVARAIVAAANGAEPPRTVVASILGSRSGRDILAQANRPVPCFTYPETAVQALAHAVRYAQWRAKPLGALPALESVEPNTARRLLGEAADPSGWVTGVPAMEVLASYGIPTQPTTAVRDPEEAAAAADRLGFPVALKASGAGIVHKSDLGGVALDLGSPGDVRAAYARMQGVVGEAMAGAVVQPMADAGVEVIVGIVQDPIFGPQVLFGLGGTAVELLGDHSLRLAPLTDVDAREMVLGLRGSPLLTGYRGSPAVDIDALVDLLLRFGRLAEDLPELAEMDANPVIATRTGAVVVDARLRRATTPVRRRDDSRRLA
jgi:acetyl coenzyme A synthetase (ADP forming)-like protein